MSGTLRTIMLATLALAIVNVGTAGAQSDIRDWNQTQDPLEGALGLHYGRLGGHGLSLRLPVQWFLYLQTSGGIWHSTDRKRHNLGAELHYVLRQDDRIRLYIAGGLGYFYDRELISETNGQQTWKKSKDVNLGVGVGLEILQGPRWSFQIEANFVHAGGGDTTKVYPQAGLYYYW